MILNPIVGAAVDLSLSPEERLAALKAHVGEMARKGGDCLGKDFLNPKTLSDGSIEYPKKGWEPPPPIDGYTRDPRNKWRFIRNWLPCKFRQEGRHTKPCGAIQIVTLCLCNDCPLKGRAVKAADCVACKFRK